MVDLNRKDFELLEKTYPGTVVFNDAAGSVTLVGWKLEQLEDAGAQEQETNNIEHDSDGARIPGVSREFPVRSIESVEQQSFLVGVIDPLAHTPEKNAGRENSCRCGRVGREKTCSIEKKDKGASNDQHLVPVIKGQFRQRVIHFFLRVFKRQTGQ